MSKMQSIDTGVPTAFRSGDGVESNGAVTAALDALALLGGQPRGWIEALQRARAAEWAYVRATSLDLAADVARREAFGERPDLIAQARDLLAAVPEEAERVRVAAELQVRGDVRHVANAVTRRFFDLSDSRQQDTLNFLRSL